MPPRSPALDRAADAGLDKQALDDLGAIYADFDTSVGDVDDMGNIAQTHAPTLLAKLHALQEGGFGQHVPKKHAGHLEHMIHRFRAIVERNLRLEHELAALQGSSNVIMSTPIDNLAAGATSTICTFGTPYSGIDFMITAALLPAELTPAGRFAVLNFMGIDFAAPSTNPANVTYLINTPGSAGQPLVQGMGLSSLLTNLTAPRGPRVFEPWTGWVFDASAKVSFSIYNPSGSFPATYLLDWMMRASPCPQNAQFDRTMALGHVRYHEGIGDMMDAIHGFAIGVGPKGHGEHRAIRSGHQMVSGGKYSSQLSALR